MKRRDAIVLGALGLIGCATGKTAQAPAALPSPPATMKCKVCGREVESWYWIGDQGPYCKTDFDKIMEQELKKTKGKIAWGMCDPIQRMSGWVRGNG